MDECRMPHRCVLKADWTEPPQDAGLIARMRPISAGMGSSREEPGGALPKDRCQGWVGMTSRNFVHAAVIDACQVPEPR
jgi:hypothetical protein